MWLQYVAIPSLDVASLYGFMYSFTESLPPGADLGIVKRVAIADIFGMVHHEVGSKLEFHFQISCVFTVQTKIFPVKISVS